eukprot:scaffold17636_cov120-Isochrysis_galbana.AAC.9
MVGRLIKQEDVRVLEQQLGQGDTTPLAARQHVHLGLPRRAPQRLRGSTDDPVQFPQVLRFDLVLHSPQLGERSLHRVVIQRLADLREGTSTGRVRAHTAERSRVGDCAAEGPPWRRVFQTG